jgi:hypothetical protein
MTDMSRYVDPLIFPMGHYLGVNFPAAGSDADFHVVRIGWDVYKLRGDEEMAVWALAHGLPDAGGEEMAPWTRGAVEAAARAGGRRNVAGAIDELMAQDLLIEVMPGTQDAIEFASVCRTRSLLIGLGNTPEDPLHHGISASEYPSPVRVDGFTFELWKWGHACDSVWHACHVMAAAGDPADPDQVDPERVLDRCLRSVQMLLAYGAIYLDEAREDYDEAEDSPLQHPSTAAKRS